MLFKYLFKVQPAPVTLKSLVFNPPEPLTLIPGKPSSVAVSGIGTDNKPYTPTLRQLASAFPGMTIGLSGTVVTLTAPLPGPTVVTDGELTGDAS